MTDQNESAAPQPFGADDWMQHYRKHEQRARDLIPANKAALFDVLANAGITHVTISFDGYGDSGQIENIEARSGDATTPLPTHEIELAFAEWASDEPRLQKLSVEAAIETLAYECLRDAHDGWENSDGAYGEFLFDVASRRIRLDFNMRFTDSTNYKHEF